MGIIDSILDFIGSIVDWVVETIEGLLDFFKNVLDWFKRKGYYKKTDNPFIADKDKLEAVLHNAPVKHKGLKERSLVRGNYDERTGEITAQEVECDGFDAETRETLGNEPLVLID
ncbi:MAG: hypothetical protein U0K36_07640 [Bacteroidales bacterium]|nr:hypothetical protein [Bacteroidales bacterium]